MASAMVAAGGCHTTGCDPVWGRWLNRVRVPVVSLRSTTGYTLSSLRDGWGDARKDGCVPGHGLRGVRARGRTDSVGREVIAKQMLLQAEE
jgi:hypothetical protein